MCQRVALERQLDSEERALLIERSQTVIRQGRDILHALGCNLGTRRRRWITHYSRTEQVSLPTPLEKYAAGLATALSRSPQITLEETPASQAILPTLLKQEQHVCQLFARLPDWTAPGINARHGTGTRSHAMINRQLSRLLLCSILGSTTLISGCALVRKDSAPHQQLKPEQIKLADDIHLASSG